MPLQRNAEKKSGTGGLTLHTATTYEADMYKVFNKRTFDDYDVAAREKAKKFWYSQGYACADNEDEYDVDLVVEKDLKRFYCEVEVKTVWHGQDFKYDSVHIPVRKAKFLKKPTKFMVFNNSLTRAAIISRKDLLDAPIKTVSNVHIRHGERFYDVPVSQILFVNTL